MIKAEKGTVMANGSAGELLTEYSEITKCIYEPLKERTDGSSSQNGLYVRKRSNYNACEIIE